ncbi:MAG TPA: non-reducing end alpha-L-arabinofuranosidase family hydrolase, partial [Polyangiaceae bacterium]|nr:non-reducing end alpha-L-arabinofuranosidase family hydrolase [Polyangiaceae bacterium]
ASGGATQSGGAIGTGGSASGGRVNGNGGAGNSAGGAAGSSNGGAPASGGGPASGGKTAGGAGGQGAGGQASGGASGGGGTASGGTSASGGAGAGGGGMACPLPTSFKWKDNGGPLATPANGAVSMKDFTSTVSNGKHVVYMTTYSTNWGAAMMSFADWSGAATATQSKLSFTAVAPTLFYFTPKQTWVLAYQWGAHGFDYRTSSDPTNPSGWSGEKSLYSSKDVPSGSSSTGVIDQQVICDTAKCYLFFAGDNGYIYRSSMAIGSFPGEFPPATTVMQDTSAKLFEAVQVYSIKGANKYLMLVEAPSGHPRYFRAFTATDLGGSWTLLTDTFASQSNTTFSQKWTSDISHGDLVRQDPSELFTVDPCNLQLLYQGTSTTSGDYNTLPYRPGLLTLEK